MNTAVLEFEGEGEPLVLAFTRLWLGYFHLYKPGEEERHPLISRLGPDPLSEDFTVQYLASAFSRKASVKALLLDQSVVAGLGNIYVDEILFSARVHPARKASTLATSYGAPSSCAAPPSTPTTTPSGRPASFSTSSKSSPGRASRAKSAARR
jgi:formamidopyrimidine-DNA glycosylase